MKAKFLSLFRDAMKAVGFDKYKLRVQDALEKKENEEKQVAINDAVAKAEAKAAAKAKALGDAGMMARLFG